MREDARRATRVLLAEARRYYRSADAGLAMLDWRCALAARTARLVYAAIGGRVEEQNCDPLAGRAVVPWWRKLFLVARAVVQGLATLPLPRPAARPPRAVLRFPDDVLPL